MVGGFGGRASLWRIHLQRDLCNYESLRFLGALYLAAHFLFAASPSQNLHVPRISQLRSRIITRSVSLTQIAGSAPLSAERETQELKPRLVLLVFVSLTLRVLKGRDGGRGGIYGEVAIMQFQLNAGLGGAAGVGTRRGRRKRK